MRRRANYLPTRSSKRQRFLEGVFVFFIFSLVPFLNGMAQPLPTPNPEDPPIPPALPNARRTVICPWDALNFIQAQGFLPINLAGRIFRLQLSPYDLGGGPIVINSRNALGQPVQYVENRIITFQGHDLNDPSNFAAFTISDRWINGFVSTEEREYWLQPLIDFLPPNPALPGLFVCEHISYTSLYTPFVEDPLFVEPLCHSDCNELYPPDQWPSDFILSAKVTTTFVDQSFVETWGPQPREWGHKAIAIWNDVSAIYKSYVGVQIRAQRFELHDYTNNVSKCDWAHENFTNNRPRDWNGGDRVLAMFVGRPLVSCGGIAHQNAPGLNPPSAGQHMIAVVQKDNEQARQVRFAAHELGHLHGATHCDGFYWYHTHQDGSKEYHHELMGSGCDGAGNEVTCPVPCSDSDVMGPLTRPHIREAASIAWAWTH